MNKLKKNLLKFIYPGFLFSVLIIISGFGSLIYVFTTSQDHSPFAYISFILSAYALIILIANIFPAFRKGKQHLENNPYTKRYLLEWEYRANISLHKGVLINSAYVIFKGVLSIYYHSVWFGAVSIYYLVLSIIRFFLLQSSKKNLTKEQAFHCYRLTGGLMLLLNITMTGMIIQMIKYDKGFSYPGYIIYASAAYTFYVVVIAIVNIVKFRKKEPIISATKMLNFVAAIMSILGLQTAMITQFDKGSDFGKIMNTITGSAVAFLTIGTAVFMIIHGSRALKKLHERRSI